MKKTTLHIKKLFSIIVFLCAFSLNAQWQQVGSDLFGQEDYYFGGAVSLTADGTLMAVGSNDSDVNGASSGEVNVFVYNGTEWIERGESLKGAAGESLGSSVAITPNGSRLIVGSQTADSANGTRTGKAQVYEWNGSAWITVGNALAGSLFDNHFGNNVSISDDGNRVAVAAINFGANYTVLGQVKIFEYNGSTWQQMGSDLIGEDTHDAFGIGMQLFADGNRIAIGAQSDNGGFNAGNIRVFEWNGSSWEQMGAEIGGDAEFSLFGNSISASGDGNRIVGGAAYYDNRRGYAKVLDWNGTSWEQKGQTIYGENFDEETGSSVSLSADGTTLVVAASYHPGGGFRRGQTRVYQLVGNLWKQVDAPINGLIDSEYCGSKTAVSANGEMVVVTSPVSSLNVPSGGAVRVYEGGVLNTESFSSLNELNVYPIPAKENISIALGREYGEITVVQYDVLGKEMNRLKVVGKTKIDFPLKGNAGVYFLKISTENSSKTIKIVKQ